VKPLAKILVWLLVAFFGALAVGNAAFGLTSPLRSAGLLGAAAPDAPPPPKISIGDATVTEGDSGVATATFAVTLNKASSDPITVNYATANGTATAPDDYLSGTGQIAFAPGVASQSVTVIVNGDTADEVSETFLVNLSAPVNATIEDPQGVGTITDDDGPAISIGDVTTVEGNSGTTTASFAVSLSAPSPQSVSVQYATANGTATAPADYVGAAGPLTFAPGQTTGTIDVGVNGDVFDEADETYLVNLSAPANGTIADSQGVGTITDDDGPPSLSVTDATVSEGNAGSVNATFTVTLSAASGLGVTVAYATSDGTATAPGDYSAAGGQVAFAAGQTTRSVSVAVNGDTLDETNETFTLALSGPTNATIADDQGVGTITDDDGPAISIGDVTVAEGDTGTTTATFAVSLSASSPQTVSISYATANGTATAPADFLAAAGTIAFGPGETTRNVDVTVNGDLFDEVDETYLVNLSGPVNGSIADGQGLGTITDDDAQPSLSVNDVTVTEGNSGTANATFTVGLSHSSGQQVTVDYATGDGTATAPADYAAQSGQVVFTAGQATRTVTVPVNGDLLDESDESFTLNLSGAVNAAIADGQGLGTITDDDALPALSIDDVVVTEGNSGTLNATFTVDLNAASGRQVSVSYATADGTATAPGDYQSRSGTLSFAPGVLSRPVTVPIVGDTLDENNETFTVNLSAAVNGTIEDPQGAGTIIDDDGQPALTVQDAVVTEGNAGTVNAVFTVTLAPGSGQTVTVDYATADGTATAGSDYQAGSGTIMFTGGVTTRQVLVPVKGDSLDEINETFTVSLSNPVNAIFADPQGVGTITDDDVPPELSIADASVAEGNSGTAAATFTVVLSTASGRSVTIDGATADATAQAPGDYFALPATPFAFAPGQTTRTITVVVNGDLLVEPDETFVVNLSNATGATIGDAQGVGTIVNDDAAPPPPPPPPPLPGPPPPPPPPPAQPRAATALFAPPAGARLTAPPLLAWRPASRARFYNVQLYRGGRKILTLWPGRARLKLRASWRYQGRLVRLRRATYTWIVWPAFGSQEHPRFGGKLGQSTFRMLSTPRA
jgi:large repetitive protein